MTRWVVAGVTSVLSLALVAGCSSSNDDANASTTGGTATSVPPVDSSPTQGTTADVGTAENRLPGEVTVLDAGAEPRSALTMTGDARARLAVDASEALTLAIGDATTDDKAVAEYELDLDLTVRDMGAELLVSPSAVSFSDSAVSAPAPDDVGTWRWVLDDHGRALRITPIGWSDQVDRAALDLLTVANLVLVTPAEPVGAGASWSQSLDSESDARLIFTLTEITETDLAVAVELIAPSDDAIATMVASGTYDRASLLARAVTVVSSLEITSPVTDNGELVELTGVQSSRRTYSEAAG